jgi:bleomycin hydrolase
MEISVFNKSLLWTVLAVTLTLNLVAQDFDTLPLPFKTINIVNTSQVKSQSRTGTCWAFTTTSFIETELLRMRKGEYDLSEMYSVRYAYIDKGDLYVRYHGMANFGPGGQAHDVMNQVRKHGFVPEEFYHGIQYGEEKHNHSELNTVLNNFLDGVIKARQITPVWKNAFAGILDTYLGKVPESFAFEDKSLTPKEFTAHLGFNPDDYVELTSYMHHPYYEKFILEVPDNWSNDLYYNLPVDDLMEVVVYALKNDYSVAWDGDMSDRGFSHKKGLAVVPEREWDDMSDEEKEQTFMQPISEKHISQKMRQNLFDNFKITDDHLMHLTGLVEDENGTYFYLTKNSWGEESNDFGGFLFMSDSFMRLHTIAIMVHKEAIPEKIARKLEL